MKKTFFLFIITLSTAVLYAGQIAAQKHGQKQIDSLLTILKTAKEDTAKVNTLNAIAYEIVYNNPDTAMYFASEAMSLAEKLTDKKGIAKAYYTIGAASDNHGNYNKALISYNNALKLIDELLTSATTTDKSNLMILKANTINGIGNVFSDQENRPESLKYYFTALKLSQEIGNKKLIVMCYLNIGNVYCRTDNFPEGMKYYLRSLQISKEIGYKKYLAALYHNIGTIYSNQGNLTDALKNFSSALKLNEEFGNNDWKIKNLASMGDAYLGQGNYSEALKSLMASLKTAEEIHSKEGLYHAYLGIGNVYYKQDNFTESLKNHLTGLKLIEELNYKSRIAECCDAIGEDYIKLKNPVEAYRYLNKGLSISKKINNIPFIEENYRNLATLDSIQGNYKQAFMNYKNFIVYRDSDINKKNTKKTMQILMQYEFDKKEEALKAAQDKKDALALAEMQHQKMRQREYYIIGTVFLIMIVIGLILYFRNKRRRDKEQLTTLFKKQLDQAETKALRAQMNPHFIFNCLNSINSFVIDQQHEIASDYLIKFSKLIRLILDNSRNETISIEKELETLRLYVFLESTRFDNKFKCIYHIDENVNTNSVMIPPMLLQPFVENAIWHGLMQKDTEGTITVEIKKENEEFLNISITDDGIGREKAAELKSKSATHKSHGLKVTSQRIEMMNKLNSTGAQIHIIDLKDEKGHATGTKVELVIPF